jgi:FkbM family methyltransferase
MSNINSDDNLTTNLTSNFKYKITYGLYYDYIDITQIVLKKCVNNNIIYIPDSEELRSDIFNDPLPGVKKYIMIEDENNKKTRYSHSEKVYINLLTNEITTDDITEKKTIAKCRIKYGLLYNNIDITEVLLEKCLQNNIIYIPATDIARAKLFTDPLPGVVKSIIIIDENNKKTRYDSKKNIKINLETNTIETEGNNNKFIIKYGTFFNNIDVTTIALSKCVKNNILFIPQGDIHRASLFNDPLPGVLKSIIIETIDINVFDYTKDIYVDLNDNKIYSHEIPEIIKNSYKFNKDDLELTDIINKLTSIQEKINLSFGTFTEEYPEQLMSTKFLTGNEKVLEIGGNIGRNSVIISSILNSKNNSNMVTLECEYQSYLKLNYNRDSNYLKFNTENAALSKKNLIQKGWNTIESNILLDGYTKVNTITLNELQQKYNIEFDTLVLDCEGAFYHILQDMPEILNNIKLIIVENDYLDMDQKNYVDSILKNKGFKVVFTKELIDIINPPCKKNFYEVWRK